MSKGKEPAFPYEGPWQKVISDSVEGNQQVISIATSTEAFSGLSKREWFAGMALQGLLSSSRVISIEPLCKISVELADAMIIKLEQSKGDL